MNIIYKKTIIGFIFITISSFFLNAQETSFGIITAPSISQKTTGDLLLGYSRLNILITNTPSGKLSITNSFAHQTGVAYRISNKSWHVQGSLLYTQNKISLNLGEERNFYPVNINTINPEIALIRRFHFKNDIELNWQIGLNAGFTTNSISGLARRGGYSYDPIDTSTYSWVLNFNNLSNQPRFAIQSSISLCFPINNSWNFELGVGASSEINKPNQWRYYHKSTHNNIPILNYEDSYTSETFNERLLFVRIGVFKKLNLKKKK